MADSKSAIEEHNRSIQKDKNLKAFYGAISKISYKERIKYELIHIAFLFFLSLISAVMIVYLSVNAAVMFMYIDGFIDVDKYLDFEIYSMTLIVSSALLLVFVIKLVYSWTDEAMHFIFFTLITILLVLMIHYFSGSINVV